MRAPRLERLALAQPQPAPTLLPDVRPRSAPAQPRLTLHIERLVLDPSLLQGGSAGQLQRAILRELGSMLGERGIAAGGSAALAHLHAADTGQAPRRGGQSLGRDIAGGIHQSLEGLR